MPEGQTVRLRKAVGGSTLTYEGEQYSWPVGEPVCEVPYELAVELLRIPGGGYSVEGEALHVQGSEGAPGSVQTSAQAGLAASREGAPQEPVRDESGKDGDSGREITEPDAEGEHKVTEPAPDAEHKVTEGDGEKDGAGKPEPESIAEDGHRTGSPITPRPQAGTRRTTAGRKPAGK